MSETTENAERNYAKAMDQLADAMMCEADARRRYAKAIERAAIELDPPASHRASR